MQSLEEQARTGNKMQMPTRHVRARREEATLGAGMRLPSDFVDNVLLSGSAVSAATNSTVTVTASQLAAARAAQGGAVPADFEVDTATMASVNMVGRYHAWRIKSSFPIPGKMVADDYRRRFLAMYAGAQDRALEPSRREQELRAEVAIAVTERFEEHRLPSATEALVGQIEEVLGMKDVAVAESNKRAATIPANDDQMRMFELMRERKLVAIENMFAAGEVNVAVTEAATSCTGLLRAASLGLLSVVRLYCKAGADCDYSSPRGIVPLHCAWDQWLKTAAKDTFKRTRFLATRDIVNELLEYGADANKKTATGLTALHMAATFGHDDIAATLLRFGADRFQRDASGRTPLDIARSNNHMSTVGLLANWGAVTAAMKTEEFRREWRGALEARQEAERRILGTKGPDAIAKVSAAARSSAHPEHAAAAASGRARDAMMRVAGAKGRDPVSSQSAESLIEALHLQERLADRRKAHAQEVADAGIGTHDPSAGIKFAEYDLVTDALREVDGAQEEDDVGNAELATRMRLGQGKDDVPSALPWGMTGKGRKKGVVPEPPDELTQAIEEEKKLEAEAYARTEARGLGGARPSSVLGAEAPHWDGFGASFAASSSGGPVGSSASGRRFSTLVRQDSTRDVSGALYGVTPRGELPQEGAPRPPSEGGSKLPALRESRTALLTVSAANRRQIGDRNATGEDLRMTEVRAAEQRHADELERAARNGGPPQNLSALAAHVAAKDARDKRRAWEDLTKMRERIRESDEASQVARAQALKAGVAWVHGSNILSLSGEESARIAALEEEAANELAVTEMIQDDVKGEFIGMDEKEVGESKFRARMLSFYNGKERVAPTDGSGTATRRAALARTLAHDAPDHLREYTTVEQGQVNTRRPALSSTLLRASRLRVDTRATLNVDGVLAKGAAFEKLMTGGIASQEALIAELGITRPKREGIADEKDERGPTHKGGDVMSTSRHGQAHSVVNDRGPGYQEEEVQRLHAMDAFAPTSARKVTLGNRAIMPAALLPGTSRMRPDAEARDGGDRRGAAGSGRTANSSGAGFMVHEEEEPLHERELRLRQRLTGGKAKLTSDAVQAALAQAAKDALTAPVVPTGRRRERKKAAPAPPNPIVYGQGVLSTLPLHQAGPLVLDAGTPLLSLASLNALYEVRRHFDAETERHAGAYARYEESKARRKAAHEAGERAQDRGPSMKELYGSAKVQKKKPPRVETEVEVAARMKAEADAASERIAMPSLTPAGAEAYSFLTRSPPKRLVIGDAEEAEKRGSRDPTFTRFPGAQDPFAGWSTTAAATVHGVD
jgi:hypothetical protein